MFGGLDLKKKDESASTAPAPAPAASGFSFLSSPAPASAPEPAPASSSFSFLNSAPAPAAETPPQSAPTSPPAPAIMATNSAFSFLSTPTASKDEEDKPAAEAPAPALSGFSFLSSDPPAVVSEPEEAKPAAPASSGFDFLSSAAPPAPAPPPMTPPVVDSPIASSPGGMPAGAGVTFGGASAVPKVVKKKRNRAAKIGVGAQAAGVPPTPAPAAPSSKPPLPTNPAPAPSDLASAALDASRRAEQFLSEKHKAESAASQVSQSPAAKPPSPFVPLPEQQDDEPDDDIVAAAKAAAEEAQSMNSAPTAKRGILGGFFKRSSPPAASPVMNSSGHSKSSLEKTPATSAADRLQKEQEEVKRAMAERQLEMMQQRREEEATKPEPFPEPEPESVSSFVPPSIVVPSPVPTPVPAPAPVSSWAPPKPTTSWAPAKKATPAPVVAAPKPTTPTDIFHEMLKDFGKQVEKATGEVTRLRQHRSGLLQDRFQTRAKERLLTQQRAQAEAAQMAAAEAEDYELADQMGTVIMTRQGELEDCVRILENITRALTQLENQKEQTVERVAKCFRAIQGKLQDFQKEHESKETEDTAEALRRFSALSKQLSTENERLQHDLKHIERDAALVAEERNELEAAIKEQAGQYEDLRDNAKVELETIEGEIEELRKQLAAKQSKAASLRTEMAGHDESVLKVRVKFSRQLTRVQKKEATIKGNREDWEFEKKSYEEQKEEHDTKVEAHSEALLARDKLLDALSREILMADTFESIVAKEIGFEVAPSEESELDKELSDLQAEVVKSEASASEAREVLRAAAASLGRLEEEVASLQDRLPRLEEVKKAAVSSRDFKAAGKASKEIKEATSRLKECEDELVAEAEGRKSNAEKELARLEQELSEKQTVAQAKERESGVAAMRRLGDNIKRLMATKDSVCGAADPHSIQSVGAFVLESQIKALKLEGQTYGEKYGGWDEILKEIGAIEAPSDPESNEAPDGPEPPDTAEDETALEAEETEAPAAIEPSPPEQEAKAEEPTIPLEERMRRFREISESLKEAELGIEAAVADEDFEKAAELEESLQQLASEVESLNLTDEEMELALSDEGAPDKPAASNASNEAETSAEEVSPAAEEVEENPEQNGADSGEKEDVGDNDPEATKLVENGETPEVNGHVEETES